MKAFSTLVFGLSLSVICVAQSNEPKENSAQSITQTQIVDLPLPKRSFRPRLSLQNALKVADAYIAKEKIDIAPYYLYEAKYILYGSKDTQDPSWFFWWINEDGAAGHYVEIVVSIKSGNVRRLPSM